MTPGNPDARLCEYEQGSILDDIAQLGALVAAHPAPVSTLRADYQRTSEAADLLHRAKRLLRNKLCDAVAEQCLDDTDEQLANALEATQRAAAQLARRVGAESAT